MERRSLIKLLALSGVTATSAGGYYWLNRHRDHSHLAIDLTLEKLDKLNVSELQVTGSWGVARTFNHLAQSIEFSMTGYPVMKSPVFRNTVGQLAFSVFQARGEMNHNIEEAIPGEDIQSAESESSASLSLQRLTDSLRLFEAYEQPLQPHFAYGSLPKDEYAIAHVMHINNHLDEIAAS